MLITVEEGVHLLGDGQVIALPTDTVYGLAADMHNRAAVDKIFAIKNRPNDRPLIILVHDISQIAPFVDSFPPGFSEYASKYWPGALTLVVPIKTDTIHDNIRAGLSTAGFRVPAHPVTLKLLKEFGPLVAPSANISDLPSSKTSAQVEHYFGSSFPILEGSPGHGTESTILCYANSQWKMTRPGALPHILSTS